MKKIINVQENNATEKFVLIMYYNVHEEGFGDTVDYQPHGHKFESEKEAIRHGFELFENEEDSHWNIWDERLRGGFYIATEDGTAVSHLKRYGLTEELCQKELSGKEEFDFSFVRFDN